MRASGQTQTSWCKEHGINTKTMANWTSKFKGEQAAAATEFLPLGLADNSQPAQKPTQIRIKVAGQTVAVTDGFNPETLKAVVRALLAL